MFYSKLNQEQKYDNKLHCQLQTLLQSKLSKDIYFDIWINQTGGHPAQGQLIY